MPGQVQWPEWWEWEIWLSFHLRNRMGIRQFNESDIRTMLEDASTYEKAKREGRYVIFTRVGREPWKIIVEPDFAAQLLVVITAYPIE